MKKKLSKLQIVLIIWLIFSTLYVLVGEYNRLKNVVAKVAYTRGASDALVNVMEESKKCKVFNIHDDKQKIDLIAVDCLKKDDAKGSVPAE